MITTADSADSITDGVCGTMKKPLKKSIIPEITEFTDDQGKKWVQTSADDLFSIKELNEIIESIDRSGDSDEIILARIDFQNVNREYYETSIRLQNRLRRQTELIKKMIEETRTVIDRKNNKLRELIDYIRKLHALLAHLSSEEGDISSLGIPRDMLIRSAGTILTEGEENEPEYEEVVETLLPVS